MQLYRNRNLFFSHWNYAGHIKTSALNGLNLNNDIVRWSRPSENIIRAEKTFGTVNIEHLYCQFRCTVQGVDVSKWIASTVLNSFDYVIRGRVHLNNAISAHIHVDGLVDGQQLNSKSTLLKQTPQRIEGSIIIGSPKSADMLMPLTFQNMMVGLVNGQNFSGFRANVVERGRRNRIVADIFTDLHFTSPLILDNLSNLLLQNSSRQKHPTKNSHRLFRMSDATDQNVKTKVEKHFHRLAVRDIYPVNISRIIKIAERTDEIEFLIFNENRVQLFTWMTKLCIFRRSSNGKSHISSALFSALYQSVAIWPSGLAYPHLLPRTIFIVVSPNAK